MPVERGQTLSHYRLVEKIGEGGMGVVWKAEDTLLGRAVAIKVLPPDTARDDTRRRLFLQEARLASSISHAHIAQVHDLGRDEGLDFIVMEYVEGKPLNRILHGRPLPPDQVAGLGVQVAQALARAHRKGLLHRDLKPGNILVTPDGEVKVVDFGLATLMGPADTTRVSEMSTVAPGTGAPGDASGAESVTRRPLAGTLPYMSPEQARGETLDTRSDIFSLGTVLYEMTTGQRPFAGATTAALLEEVVKARPKPPHELVPKLPLELDRIIRKGLAPSRADRYQTMEDLAVDLKRLARDLETGSSPSYGDLKTVPGPARRARFWILAASLVALIAGVVAALLLGLNVDQWRERLLRGAAPKRIDSLAVLPLVNLSRDPEQEYFADGMTDALIADLSKIGALRVISRTSVMRYKGSSKPLAEIVRELNVNAIIEGSILRSGDRVRITAQLVEGATDRHLWAESYERDLGDVLALQSEVAQAIAREIKVTLTSEEHARLAAAPAVDPGVYEAYLRGRYHWNKRTGEGLAKAIEYFEQAIETDPMFAPAYAGLADSYILRYPDVVLPRKEVYARARQAATRALEIDDTLAEAHTSMASTMDAAFDWTGAEREYRRAIQLNPSYATAHHWYAAVLSYMGRHDEAIAEITKARDLDPLSLMISVGVGQAYMFARQYDQAIVPCQEALEMDPNFVAARNILGYAYEAKEMYKEAIAEFKKGIELSGGDHNFVVGLAHVYAVSGQRSEARKVLDDLLELSKRRYVSPAGIAEVYAGLGEKNRALEFLDKAYQESDPELALLAVDPWLDPLRSEPRFADLLRRVGLPP